MSDYKRLSEQAVEILNKLHTERLDYQSEYLPLIDCAQALGELADKLEEGTLVELPCKVGDTVYIVGRKYRAGSYESFINTGKFRYSDIEKFGDIVFITREAAEARLKELEK